MEQLGRYLLERRLAQGGMAEVYVARDAGTQQQCVVKRMLSHLSEDVTFIEMFLDEARVVAQLSHPGIARVFDFGHEQDTYFLALEYVPGANLKAVIENRLESKKPVPLPVAARITALVAQALDYAHHATDAEGKPLSIIHRDVSPHNVLVGINGDVKLIDFGIAKAATDSHRTVAGTLKGKYAYMSPEQLRQQKVDMRTDIYALGLVLYELITGRAAVAPNDNMNALMMAAAQRRYAPIDQFRPETPKRLRQILDKALALDPNDRFQRGSHFSDQLEEWLASTGTRVVAKDIALLVDPKLVSTDPMAKPAPPALADDEVPPTVVGSSAREARTLQDMVQPRELRETLAGRTKDDRTPVSGSNPVDPSFAPTPIMGTPPVARRAVAGTATDVSLMPTEPEKKMPDIKAAMSRPPKSRSGSAPKLESVTAPSVPKPAFTPKPEADAAEDLSPETLPPDAIEPRTVPVQSAIGVPATTVSPGPSTHVLMEAAGLKPQPRRWPWILVIALMLPIGLVSGGIVFLPKDSAVRAKLLEVVGPLLSKLQR